MKKLVWNTYTTFRFSSNEDKEDVHVYNVFDNFEFDKSLRDIKKKKIKKFEQFKKELQSALMYTFWCRYEYESVITTYPISVSEDEVKKWIKGNKNDKFFINQIAPEYGAKIDVYEQVMLNFDIFAEYVWNNLNLIK